MSRPKEGKGEEIHHRLANVTFRVGDVLLLQGREKMLQEAITTLGCLPLVKRGLTPSRPRAARRKSPV
jgi:hypothetical protein